ncbi:MAG: hypothetical protein ACI8T1_002294 [Verrucomicrobiales bacterium]|jgi:hypothetical protein
MKSKSLIQAGLISMSFLIVMGIFGMVIVRIVPCGYLYCILREDSWLASTDQKQLESKIHVPHKSTEIAPQASSWGHDHVLEDGQKMIRYLIVGAPLEVVVAADGSIDSFYTSYE